MKKHPACWVPTLYFAEGVPYNIATFIFTVLLADLAYNEEQITLWSSLIAWPWVVKALWAPLLDVFGSKRAWILIFQGGLAAALALAALVLNGADPLIPLALVFMLVAFLSSSHDIAADGFYIIGLSSADQSLFCGLRSTFYRVATIGVQGGLVALAGYLAIHLFPQQLRPSWTTALLLAAAVMALLALWHALTLPKVEAGNAASGGQVKRIFHELAEAFVSFFRKPGIGRALVFLLFFRIAEAPLSKVAVLFLKADRAAGGLALGNEAVGLIYGTIGVGFLLAGGILGGVAVNRWGLGKCMLPMALLLNIPDIVYVLLARYQPEALPWIGGAVAVEQFGYGFGFAAYMLFMVAYTEDSGRFKTSHFAFMTGFMALGLNLPGLVAGAIQMMTGYYNFFWIVMICVIPAILTVFAVKGLYRPDFGRTGGGARG